MSQDLMNYDKMTQLALRGVVRDAIRRVIREDGLPGAHHFYITFLTRFPGVDIDETLASKYDEEITVVLEHQYWDLLAHDDSFEVTLKFGGVPKYLSVPYTAITRFHDPSVGFAMQFDPPEETIETPPTIARLTPDPKSKPAIVEVETTPKTAKKKTTKKKTKAKKKTSPVKAVPNGTTPDDTTPDGTSPDDTNPDDDGGNTVVSLDSFRKK